MPHKSGFLSGAGPQEEEKETTAQINDRRNPEAMRQSSELSRHYNETDDRPAIEQTFNRNEVKAAKHTGKNFAIDSEFERAMHERERAERQAREAKRKKQAEAEKVQAQAKADKVAEDIKHSQSLDPEQLKAQNLEEQRAANLQKLYPDPLPEQSDIEEELWRQRKDKGTQIAGRAKLEDVYDSELHQSIKNSAIISILGLFISLPIIEPIGYIQAYIKLILSLGGSAAMFFSFILLRNATMKYRNKTIPNIQADSFKLATLIPFIFLRLFIISIFSQLPIVGGFVGVLAGVFIGSSLHYTFLNKFNINPSSELVALNTVSYIAVIILPSIVGFIMSPSGGPLEMLTAIIWVAQTGLFLVSDYYAAKTAPGHFS